MRKAQGISMNVIIIAALALLVLVVLSVIFLGRIGIWGQQTKDCATQGGTCVPSATYCTETTEGTVYSALSCSDAANPVCCVPVS